jgi:glycosyltransferase involved in cell wall biosynthesis
VNTDPVLTLVVTAHHTRYLTEALTSVAAQTTEDFDLVCCADSSAGPEVPRIFEEYAPFIRCRGRHVLSVKGGTAGRVRNAGFAAARTGWVA